MPQVSQPSLIVFLSLVALVHVSVSILLYRFSPKAARIKLISAWVAVPALSGALALAGITQRLTLPPPILFLNLTLIAGALFLIFSKNGRALAQNTPLRVLIGLQAFRLPLELLLNTLGEAGAIPIEMTFHGYNFDIITGILALGYLIFPNRLLGWLVQAVGVVCLLVIFGIVLISLPIPFGITTPALILPTGFPFIWLPAVLVLAAILLHGLSIRALLLQKNIS